MKCFKFLVLSVSLIFLSISVFPQTNENSKGERVPTVTEIQAERTARIKADILQEIQTFERKDQAKYYTWLGDRFWIYDQKEALAFFTKGIEIGISPATEYKNDSEKLTYFWNLLHYVLTRDNVLADKMISKIKEIKIDQSDSEMLESANRTYILIAQQILYRKGNENLAFEFAMLSLAGTKPAFSSSSLQFLVALKNRNENLANIYFNKLIESAKTNERFGLAVFYLFQEQTDTASQMARRNMPDAYVKVFLENMLFYVQRESEAVYLRQRNDCLLTKDWGLKYLAEYKRLLPEKSSVIEQAIFVCQNSEIENWKKPDFSKRPRKTSQDWLDLAKEISDKKIQANYLISASFFATKEKNYPLANEILESVNEEFRNLVWLAYKIQNASNHIEELLKNNNNSEVTRVLESLPENFRPFIIIRSLFSIQTLKSSQKEFVMNLLNQARAILIKVDKFTDNTVFYPTNPLQFGQLTLIYVSFGFYPEAIESHEQSINLMNRLFKTLNIENKERTIPPFSDFGNFTNAAPPFDLEFVYNYFDQIYENINKIENSKVRINARFNLIRKTLEKPVKPFLRRFSN